jgi:hypothetical protein
MSERNSLVIGQQLWHFAVEMKHAVSIRRLSFVVVLALLAGSVFPSPAYASVCLPKTASFFSAPYLNPNTGRFWTKDSYTGNQSDPLSLHKYLYCHADPVNFTDPSGNVEFSILGLNVSIDNRLIIGALVLTGSAIAYHRYVWDPTEHDMKAIPITELEAELRREPERERRLEQIIDSSGQRRFRDVGLVSGGKMSVVMNTENGAPGQRIRNIWENPKNRAGWSSASDELMARFFAARGGANDAGGFIQLMADENAVTTDGRVEIAEALLTRHQAYDKWLQIYIDKKRGN